MRVKQTRFKLSLIALGLFFIEAWVKMLVPEFPFTGLMAAQGVIVGGYLGAKTTNNIKEKRINVQND